MNIWEKPQLMSLALTYKKLLTDTEAEFKELTKKIHRKLDGRSDGIGAVLL